MYPKSSALITDKIQEIMDNAVLEAAKTATKFGMRLLNGTYLLSLPYSLQKFKCDRRDFMRLI